MQERNEASLLRLLRKHSHYLAEALGSIPLQSALRPPHAVVLAREKQSVGSEDGAMEFTAVLACPALAVSSTALLEACSGNRQLVQSAGGRHGACCWQDSKRVGRFLQC